MERIPKSESAQKVDPGKFTRRSCSDSNPRPFNHESGALTPELSPLPNSASRPWWCPLSPFRVLLLRVENITFHWGSTHDRQSVRQTYTQIDRKKHTERDPPTPTPATHTHAHASTCTHTHIHTHTHTHTHTCHFREPFVLCVLCFGLRGFNTTS